MSIQPLRRHFLLDQRHGEDGQHVFRRDRFQGLGIDDRRKWSWHVRNDVIPLFRYLFFVEEDLGVHEVFPFRYFLLEVILDSDEAGLLADNVETVDLCQCRLYRALSRLVGHYHNRHRRRVARLMGGLDHGFDTDAIFSEGSGYGGQHARFVQGAEPQHVFADDFGHGLDRQA